jgi:GWxTD domain-containing protein
MFILLVGGSRAQALPMNFLYTYSAFAYSDSTSLVEFNYQFSDRGITYPEGSGVGKLFIRLTLHDSTRNGVLSDGWIVANPKPAEGSEERALLSNRLLELHPGVYRVQLYYEDAANRSHRDSTNFTMTVRDFTAPRLQLSDVQIASEISMSSETTDQFYKNGYVVYPNVAGYISEPFLQLNTYMEAYNADRVPTAQYTVSYSIADSTFRIFYQKDVKRDRSQGHAVLELNSIYLEELASGEYYLIVKAYNGLQRMATDSAMVIRRFSVSNPRKDSALRAEIARRDEGVGIEVDPIYAGLKESELDVEFKKVRYIATEPEKNLWEQIHGAEAKGRFLSAFWLRRDPTPGTSENENLDAYQKRLREAIGLYTSPMTPNGWDSDRGRILLQYGKPDNQDRHFQDYNRKPYEIWTYSQLGYTFVFVDRTQTGTYPLVHSDAPGEFKFENWEQEFAMLDKHLED